MLSKLSTAVYENFNIFKDELPPSYQQAITDDYQEVLTTYQGGGAIFLEFIHWLHTYFYFLLYLSMFIGKTKRYRLSMVTLVYV